MPAKDKGGRQARLAAALKENLKRRKHQASQKAQEEGGVQILGTAPPASLENKPEGQQKSAPKTR
jgi:hypothetical protein